MVLSPYVVALPDLARSDCCLLFGTRKGALVRVSQGLWRRLRGGEVPEAAAEPLARAGILVADAEEERRRVLGYLEAVNRADPGVTAAVFLGLACNFACPYCYEKPLGRAGAMGEATAERLCAFLLGRLRPGKSLLTVDFYGGEPLLYLPLLRRIAGALQAGAAARGAHFRFTLVTNGSLLTRRTVDSLGPLGLASAKVTLDGPPHVHDRSRPLRSGRGSFQAILRNLKEVAGIVPLGVGANYTAEAWRELPRLLDRLAAEGLGPERIARVHFAPVMQTGACAGCATPSEPWLPEAATVLRGEALRRGYRVPPLAPTPCMVDLDDAFAVGWDGRLWKCPGLVGREGFACGDLWAGPGPAAPYRPGRWRDEPACRACPYLPLCFGGCRCLQFHREATLAGVDCQRPFWEAALPALVS